MKILLACAAFQPRGLGGGPQASYVVARALIEHGLDVRVVTVGEHDAVENYRGIEVHVVKSPNIYWNYLKTERSPIAKAIWHVLEGFNPRAYLRMRRQVKAFRPDVVMTISIENINVATWLLARLHRIPVVHVLHSYFLMCWRGSLYRNDRKCVVQCVDCTCISAPKKALSRLVDGVFGESRAVVDEHLVRGYFKDALREVIPSGLEPVPGAAPKRRDGPLIVGFMSVLAPHKGLETLARAAARLAGSDLVFKVAGTGDAAYKDAMHAAFGDADVEFLGWVDAVKTYSTFDVLVVPSTWSEPFARIVIESMSHGVPVICSDAGGAHESIVDGVSGRIFKAGDIDMLEQQLRELEADEDARHAMATAALESTRRYESSRTAVQMEHFIERVLSRKGKAGSAAAGNVREEATHD